jgi:hypothetical protein
MKPRKRRSPTPGRAHITPEAYAIAASIWQRVETELDLEDERRRRFERAKSAPLN